MATEPLDRRRLILVSAGIFLVSCGLVSMEIVLTRILSIRNHYHLAFMLISLAMLGLGASGSYLSVSKKARTADPLALLTRYAVLFSIAAMVFAIVGTKVPSDLVEVMHLGWWAAIFLVIYPVLMFVPFFFAGAAIGVALFRYTADVNRIYFADLVGAGIGCVIAVPNVILFGGAGAVVVSAILGLGGAALFRKARTGSAGRAIPVALVLIAAILPAGWRWIEIEPGYTKFSRAITLQHPESETVYSEWTATGRVDVQQLGPGSPPFMTLGVGAAAEGDVPHQKLIHVDGEATTQLNQFSGDFNDVRILRRSLYSAAYQVLDKPDVLVIGVGGGTDVLTGLMHGARHVTGVELNGPTIRAVKDLFAGFDGGIYSRPDVTIVHGEGRAFVRRDPSRYDLVQLTGVDTHAALASGAYTLAENYLYTAEGIEDFLGHLKPGGVLSFMRWVFDPPRESLRLATMAAEALSRRGLNDAGERIAVLQNGVYQGESTAAHAGSAMFASVLIKPAGFSEVDVDRLERFAAEAGMDVLHLPHRPPKDNAFSRFLTAPDRDAFIRDYPFHIAPATDDAPFFYNYYRWGKGLFRKHGSGGPLLGNVPIGQIVLVMTAIQGFFFGVLLILAPLFLFKRRDVTGRGKPAMTVYFGALGFGFMFIELAALQKFILFLHHPAYATSVVLFAMLVFAGLGSFVSGRWPMSPAVRVAITAAVVIAMTALYVAGIDALLAVCLALPLPVRIAIAVALLAPLGFALGMPFPAGLSVVERISPGLVAWAWGINGCTSVLGAIAAVVLAMAVGFAGVFTIAAGLYVLAALAIWRLSGIAGRA